MSEAMERAHETIHEHASHSDRWARGVAVLVSFLAAALALTEIGGKAAQTAYLTHHVAVSDDWAFYQAKNLRAVVRTSEADLLASLPNAADPAIQARIKEASKQFPYYAVPRAVWATLDAWTIENSLITPTLKLKRNALHGRLAPAIDGLYQRNA